MVRNSIMEWKYGKGRYLDSQLESPVFLVLWLYGGHSEGHCGCVLKILGEN